MFKVPRLLECFTMALGLALSFSGSALAASNAPAKKMQAPGITQSAPTQTTVALTFSTAFDVFDVYVNTDGTFLTVGVKDCCIVGDQWAQRTYCLHNGQQIDQRGIGRGDTSTFTGTGTVYKKGGQNIQCIVEIRYSQGVSVFPAGMTLQLTSSSGATINNTVLSAPVPLPSM